MQLDDLLVSLQGLRSIEPDQIRQLETRGQRVVFLPQGQLMRQGDPPDRLYVILSGRVSVERLHPHLTSPLVLAELGAGEIVGEMGLLDGEPRSATVTALERTEAVSLTVQELRLALAEVPQLCEALLKTLSRRLRTADDLAAGRSGG